MPLNQLIDSGSPIQPPPDVQRTTLGLDVLSRFICSTWDEVVNNGGKKSKLAEAIRYALSRWPGLTRFLDDGRIEIDSNVVERSIRPIALNRKNALFAGSDGGGEHWAVIASLVETCKLNAVDPQAYLADAIARIVTGHPQSRIDDLLPWAYATQPLKAVA